jgi:hypothetical protein
LDRIERVEIRAMLRRDRHQTAPKFAPSLRSDAWEVPLVEIRWRNE